MSLLAREALRVARARVCQQPGQTGSILTPAPRRPDRAGVAQVRLVQERLCVAIAVARPADSIRGMCSWRTQGLYIPTSSPEVLLRQHLFVSPPSSVRMVCAFRIEIAIDRGDQPKVRPSPRRSECLRASVRHTDVRRACVRILLDTEVWLFGNGRPGCAEQQGSELGGKVRLDQIGASLQQAR